MREQRGLDANSFTRRASLPPDQRTYYEDNPYITYGKQIGRTYVTTRSGVPAGYDDVDYDDDEPRTRSSVVVRIKPPTQVQRVRIRETDGLPAARLRRHLPPLFYVCLSLLIIVLFIMAYIAIPQLWQRHLDDMQYGYPRTYQTDANVGHGGISHFIVLNRHGTIEVVELPQNPRTNTPRLYIITTFVNDGADLIPATVAFYDLTGSGRLDMIVTVYNGSNPTIYQLYNNGTQFTPHI